MKFTAMIIQESTSSLGVVIPHEIVKKLKLKAKMIKVFDIENNE